MNRFEGEVIERGVLTADQDAHLGRVTSQHVGLVQSKFVKGQVEHGGDCHLKPGMLAHALDEVADLTVYLWTCREQMLKLADRLREGFLTKEEAADEIERWLHK